MQIERLTICNFRGIKDEFEIEANGENVVLVGPNGSGKSSVVSAVDFLLAGTIQDLTGSGTGGISPKRHGPHVDADIHEAWVEADVSIKGKQCIIRRQLEDPNELIIEDASEEQRTEVYAALNAADQGLHVLSREEILDFITAPNSTRFDRIQTLLDIEVDSQRKALRRTASHFDNKADRLTREAATKRSQLRDKLDVTDRSVRDRISQLRKELGGDELSPTSNEFRAGIKRPTKRVTDVPLLQSNAESLVTDIQQWYDEMVDEFLEQDNELRQLWQEVHQEQAVLSDLEHRRLLELGQDALDPAEGVCPLCLTEWDVDELNRVLTHRLEQVSELNEITGELKSVADAAQQSLTDIRVTAESLLEVVRPTDRFDVEPIESFVERVEKFEADYDEGVLTEPPFQGMMQTERRDYLTPDAIEKQLDAIENHQNTQPNLSALQERWEMLKTADRLYDEMIAKSHSAARHQQIAEDCETVHEEYLKAKNHVLEQVYQDIEEQFEAYYRKVHQDEQDFTMSLEPTTAGVDLEVDFYDRGEYQPHALHSEGHQDSMGICLYFALCDWLNEIEGHSLVMLDDVVMSIDNGHRRPLAELLASTLNEKYQLFITTHDDSWHRHLRSEGVVSASNTVQLSGWDLANGPHTHENPEMEWGTVYNYLENEQVSQAAHQTRLIAEWYLKEACDNLDAKVPFKSNGKWTMGDFKSAAISRYKELLKRSKAAENSWNRDTSELAALEKHAKDIFERCNQDGSALNPNIHWNEADTPYADYSGDELRPAVEAYHDLFNLFWCENCNSSLRLIRQGEKFDSMSCRCKKMKYNLVKK